MIAREGTIFVSKTAAVVLGFLTFTLFATVARAQLIPSGNVYVGVSEADSVDVVNRYTFRGWNASFEDMPLPRHSYFGVVIDGSGFYRKGIQQYDLFLGPRISRNYGKWRPFVQLMGGIQIATSDGIRHYPVAEDLGGGVDRKFHLLFLHNFAWRLQFDYVHTRLLSANQNDYRGSVGLVWRF
jgi:hypothetical protein